MGELVVREGGFERWVEDAFVAFDAGEEFAFGVEAFDVGVDELLLDIFHADADGHGVLRKATDELAELADAGGE